MRVVDLRRTRSEYRVVQVPKFSWARISKSHPGVYSGGWVVSVGVGMYSWFFLRRPGRGPREGSILVVVSRSHPPQEWYVYSFDSWSVLP